MAADEKNQNQARSGSFKPGPWQISTFVLAVLLVISVVLGIVGKSGQAKVDEKEASDKAIEFVNNYLLRGRAQAELEGIEETSGIYNIKLNIKGKVLDSYLSFDGKFFFPQGVNLEMQPEVAQQNQPAEIPKREEPEVELFTMSFCPYGNQAEDGIKPVAELLGKSVEIKPHYVIYSNYQGGGPQFCLDPENKYCSMHGIQELNQNVRELCVYKHDQKNYWNFVDQINKKCNARNVDECWEPVAAEMKLDAAKIKSCQQKEAIALLEKEVELNQKYQVRGSPTLVINGMNYQGGRSPEDYKQAICSAFTEDQAPEKCQVALGPGSGAAPPAGKCQ